MPAPPETTDRPAPGVEDDGLGAPAEVPKAGRRARIRSKPGVGQAYRVGVFLAGLLCIALGIGLAVLPGPLTIPPVLLGLWIWSTEFRFAERFFESFKEKGRSAWSHAKRNPVASSLVTVGGLAAAVAVGWAVSYFELIERAKTAIGV